MKNLLILINLLVLDILCAQDIPNYHIYICDRSNNRIVRIDNMLGTNWIAYGDSGSGIGQFNYPNFIFVDDSNKIYN
jgi:hypothetical protein